LNFNKVEFYRTIYWILIPIFVILFMFLFTHLPLSTQDNVVCGMIVYLIVGYIIERIAYWINNRIKNK